MTRPGPDLQKPTGWASSGVDADRVPRTTHDLKGWRPLVGDPPETPARRIVSRVAMLVVGLACGFAAWHVTGLLLNAGDGGSGILGMIAVVLWLGFAVFTPAAVLPRKVLEHLS
jgi:hypothetical protein